MLIFIQIKCNQYSLIIILQKEYKNIYKLRIARNYSNLEKKYCILHYKYVIKIKKY